MILKLRYSTFSLLMILTLVITGCSDDDEDPQPLVAEVLVINEGNFTAGNGTIWGYNVETGAVSQDLYEANATIQTIQLYNGDYYMVTNVPDQLVILDGEDLSRQRSISVGLDNPFGFAAVGNTGFISNWGDSNTAFTDDPDSYIAIADLASGTITDSILLGARPQHLIALDGRVYIANEGGNAVSVVDPTDLSLSDIEVPAGPSAFQMDAQGGLWVLCASGNLVEIDPSNNSVGRTLGNLTTAGFNEKTAIHLSSNTLYFLGGGNATFTGQTNVFAVDLNATTLSATTLITNGFAFYGIGVNPENGEIFVGDSNGAFDDVGTGFRYDSEGNLLGQFGTGIGPNGFVFRF